MPVSLTSLQQFPDTPAGRNPPPLRILLVEDSPSDTALLQEALVQSGMGDYQFWVVETLAGAIELLSHQEFDLLLLDLSLPDSQGPETFIRARAAAPRLPIVLLTGVDDEAVGLAAVRQGIQDYLVKNQAYGRQTARSLRYAIERKRTEEALKQAETALQRERDLLEARVQQRTGELSEANRALQAEMAQRQRAEAAHQQVLRRLSEAQETERGRISRELHDRLGQDLTALKLGLQMLRKQGPFATPVQSSIGKLEKLAEGLMRDIHRLAWELRPSTLDDLGLELALERYTTEWSEGSSIRVDFHSDGLEGKRLPLEYETALYRVAQEALTNILRHAQARRVSVLLERRPGFVSLIVEDDGRGFDADALLQTSATQGKLGLLGMGERVKLVGGTFTLESVPGAGTTVFARLPLGGAAPQQTATTAHEEAQSPYPAC
ncbi:MAG TPA: response regulator [Verrucomicrobiae bacterium]|nr:response regulator [Verrucomicrobiae bacterium]